MIAPAPAWGLTDAALRSVGELLRRFHDAAAGFDPSPYAWPHRPPSPHDTGGMLHNDPNLDNFVFRDGRAVALIDFDLAAPGAPLWDVAATARLWAPLRSPADIADDRRDRALARARILVDAYGLDEAGRAGLVDAVRASHDWMVGVVADGAAHGVTGLRGLLGPRSRRPRPPHRRLARRERGSDHRAPSSRPEPSLRSGDGESRFPGRRVPVFAAARPRFDGGESLDSPWRVAPTPPPAPA